MVDNKFTREQMKAFKENEKNLADRLMREKPSGIKGLTFVIEQVLQAIKQGLIYTSNPQQRGHFANLIYRNIAQKLSKQKKDKELIRVIL